jgi:hypothetical protein
MLKKAGKEVDKRASPSCSKNVDRTSSCFQKVTVEPVPFLFPKAQEITAHANKMALPSCTDGVEANLCSSSVDSNPVDAASLKQVCSPRDIIPVPQVNMPREKTTHNRGKTAVLTASPYYRVLLEKNSPVPQKLVNTVKRKVFEGKQKDKPEQYQGKRKRVDHVSPQPN